MKKECVEGKELDQYLGCFGSYSALDTICQQKCALNLQCAIEKDHNSRMELLEDLIASDGYSMKMQ
jgi:hypothetical protein